MHHHRSSPQYILTQADLVMTKLQDDGGFELQTKRWTELIELRQALTGHKMDPTSVDIPLLALAEIVKPEEAFKASVTEQPSPTAETLEPAELDASGTAITKQWIAGIGKPAELEDSEIATIERSLSSTRTGKPAESLPQPSETRPMPIGTETSKPAEMPSQPTAMEIPSLDAEHITIIGTSIEEMDLGSSPAATSPPLTKAPSVLTSPSTVRSTPSTKAASSASSPRTSRSKPSAKRNAPTETRDTLGSAQNPICLESSPAAKRQRRANNVLPRAVLKKTESWKVAIQSVGIMGLHLKPRCEGTDLSIVFDVETQRLVFYKGQRSLTALYSDLEINLEALLSVTRPTYTQSKHLKVRFMWQDPDGEESFLDIMVATKQDCRELVARLKGVTSFSEIILSEYVVPFLSFAVFPMLIEYSILDPA
ncbi:MAG: hypothetical protein ASARMPRED_001216 [Alectoria sarmentosa]|nr:MAG: hypothetical protein ASARMPRED_001216 [Alectoria sarmentosa]